MGAWIEILCNALVSARIIVAPAWGRGLKYELLERQVVGRGRPRMGAWIEIFGVLPPDAFGAVAPAWGRGLKYQVLRVVRRNLQRRPRMGAWIEIRLF